MAVVVNPQAGLPARDGDEQVTPRQLEQLSLCATLKQKPTFAKFPGSVVLRRYRQGETIVRLGDAGWTAFYVLTTEDMLTLRQAELKTAEERLQRPATGQEKSEWRQRLAERIDVLRKDVQAWKARAADLAAAGSGEAEQQLRRAVTAFLPLGPDERPKPVGRFQRLLAGFRRPRAGAAEPPPLAIAHDGPTDIDGHTKSAAMYEGELFGEMSCMTRMPRSATVRAERDLYLLEMLGNVLDMIRRDDGYRELADKVYRERAMNLQLRMLPIIGQLPPELFRRIQQRAKLVTYEPGSVVWDEHDPADSLCLVRSGLVQIVRGLNHVIGPEDVSLAHRRVLCQELVRGEHVGDPVHPAWRLLDDAAQAAVRRLAGEVKPESGEGQPLWESVRGAINTLIKGRRVIEAFSKSKKAELLAAAGLPESPLADAPEKVDEWNDLHVRLFNRLWLESCVPAIPLRRLLAVRRRTLAYVGRGEFFGEGCVLPDRVRRGTCVAYSHPDTGQSFGGGRGVTPSRLELVRIRREDLLEILTPELLEQIREVARQRLGNNVPLAAAPAAEQLLDPMHPHFEELGLLQGQKLMLVDLDRCTRCGDCMRACINTHADGASRLFLDGPRFGNYLVPSTCRQCLDPVCMIGCPVRSIVRGENGQIEIKSWCIGCRACADQCPYGSIQMQVLTQLRLTTPPPPPAPAYAFEADSAAETEVKEVTLRAVVCDQCANSPLGEPACVYHCPHDAAFRVEGRALVKR
jgi:Fe-S-cluster-containing dehydrogenase component/CRP-like cAMP-binding protein